MLKCDTGRELSIFNCFWGESLLVGFNWRRDLNRQGIRFYVSALCVKPVNKRLWKVFNLLYRMMSQKLLLFQLQLFLLFYFIFSLERSNFHFAQKSFAFNTKYILLVREQKIAFNCWPPVCLTVGTLFYDTKIFFNWLPMASPLNFYCICDYVLYWSIYHKTLCFSRDDNTLPRFFSFFPRSLWRTSLAKPGKSSPRHRTIWRFFPPRKATFLFTQKLVILT